MIPIIKHIFYITKSNFDILLDNILGWFDKLSTFGWVIVFVCVMRLEVVIPFIPLVYRLLFSIWIVSVGAYYFFKD